MQFIDLKTQYQTNSQRIRDRISKVLEHGQYIMGPEVLEVEERLARYVGVRHCITVGSGTEALLISLMALGVSRGDEVITTPFSFASTVEVIVLLGATPVFVDVLEDTCNLDPSLLKEKISPKTKAIIPVSLYGQPANMKEIQCIADSCGSIAVIEDGAQSFGAMYRGSKSGNLSRVGCTSFFPSKPLGCYGDGGAIFTSDDELATTCREIRNHGQISRYQHSRVGICGRMDTIQCAVLLAKLETFEAEISHRRKAAAIYSKGLAELNLQLLKEEERVKGVFAQYTILVDDRKSLIDSLSANNIPSSVHYPVPLNMQPAYQHLNQGDTPIALYLSQKVISLPMSGYITMADQNLIMATIEDWSRKLA